MMGDMGITPEMFEAAGEALSVTIAGPAMDGDACRR